MAWHDVSWRLIVFCDNFFSFFKYERKLSNTSIRLFEVESQSSLIFQSSSHCSFLSIFLPNFIISPLNGGVGGGAGCHAEVQTAPCRSLDPEVMLPLFVCKIQLSSGIGSVDICRIRPRFHLQRRKHSLQRT